PSFTDVQPEDLIKFGLIPEFIGRLPVVTAVDYLDEDALIRVLTEPKNALSKQYQKMFALDGVQLEFDEGALEAIVAKLKHVVRELVDCGLSLKTFCNPLCLSYHPGTTLLR